MLLAELQIQQATRALDLIGSAFLDRLTLMDNLGNISSTGDLMAYDLHVSGGVGGIDRRGVGNLRLVDASFESVLGLLGVIRSRDGAASHVRLDDVAVTDSTGGLLAAVSGPRPSTG